MKISVCQPVMDLLALWACSLLSGCSLVGFVGGSILDASIPDKDVFLPSAVDSIQPGREITVLMTDSTTVSGQCAGWDDGLSIRCGPASPERAALARLENLLPVPGETLLVSVRTERGRSRWRGVLAGLTPRTLRLQSENFPGGSVNLLFAYIDTVHYGSGAMVSGDTLRGYSFDWNDSPVNRRLLVLGEKDTTCIPAGSILEVTSANPHNRKWWGLGLGAVIDGAIIYSLSQTSLGPFLSNEPGR